MKKHASTSGKIVSLDELASIARGAKKKRKKVVLCHGVFDLLHPGHIRHFEEARAQGALLLVTITPDKYVNKGPGRPVFTETLRAEAVAALLIVDYVAINKWPSAVKTIRLLKPDVYAKGSEYEKREDDLTGKISEEEQTTLDLGGRIHFTHDIIFSSTALLNTHFNVMSKEMKSYIEHLKRQYTAADIIELLKRLKDMKVLVVGDVIIDEYCFCRVLGRASKTASINAKFLSSEMYAGGALAVANHVAGLCGQVHFVSCLGEQNTQREFIDSHLKPTISTHFFTRPDGPTTLKRRFVDQFLYQKMFEVTFIEDRPLPSDTASALDAYLERHIGKYDLVIVADFGHGMITESTIDVLCSKAKYLAMNSQTNSANMGFNRITKYPRADYICIDQEEMRLATHDRFGPLDELIRWAADEFEASVVTVTQGQHGSSTLATGKIIHTPVLSRNVVDTIGAGDAYLSISAPCAAAGYPADIIGLAGNAAGALASQVLGNKEAVDPVALFKFITTLLK